MRRYAFTFGQYLGYVVDLGPWFPRLAGIAIVALFIGLNLRGVGEAGGVEVFLVWFKLVVLVGLAGWGLDQWDPPMLSRGVTDAGISAVRELLLWSNLLDSAFDWDGLRSMPVRGSSFLRREGGVMNFEEGEARTGSFNPVGRSAS
jgi:amino acid transporter